MAYINIETNEYPRYQGDIRLIHPEMGEEFICPPCFVEVKEGPLPEVPEGFTLIRKELVVVDGDYLQEWDIQEVPTETLEKYNSYPADMTRAYEWDEKTQTWYERNPLPFDPPSTI